MSALDDIYGEAKKLGVEMDHHESDLYLPVTPETTALVNRYKHRCIVTRFTKTALSDKKSRGHSRKGKPIRQGYDIPFAYQPFWDKVTERLQRRLNGSV